MKRDIKLDFPIRLKSVDALMGMRKDGNVINGYYVSTNLIKVIGGREVRAVRYIDWQKDGVVKSIRVEYEIDDKSDEFNSGAWNLPLCCYEPSSIPKLLNILYFNEKEL